MKKPRLLALTTSYPLRPGSSAGVFVQSLYRALSAAYTIDVVCPADTHPTASVFDDPSAADIRVHAVRYAPAAWRTLAQASGGVVTRLRRAPWYAVLLPALLLALFWRTLVRARHTDVIHANWAACGLLAGLVGRLCRKPVIVTLRGSDVTRATRFWLDRAILRLAVRNSRSVVCVSEAMAGHVRALFPKRAADIHACLNGVDEVFFHVVRSPAAGGLLRVLAVGNLIRLKAFDVLIEALARAPSHDRMEVCIVGDGPEREALSALAASCGVSACCTFAGRVPTGDMPARYADADILILSSRSEGRPNVVVEALAAGLPVISTRLEGVQGMVEEGDTGWLVPVDDAGALAAALDQAVADRAELYRRGERARVLARTRIGTWADTARGYEALFRAALAPHARQCPPCAE